MWTCDWSTLSTLVTPGQVLSDRKPGKLSEAQSFTECRFVSYLWLNLGV